MTLNAPRHRDSIERPLVLTYGPRETNPPASAASQHYHRIRQFTVQLCAPLIPEDMMIQSMPDASPTRWHIAHTTWFFETFFLPRALANYRPYHPRYAHLFNSYYQSLGQPFARSKRGLLSRPSVAEIFEYRDYVDWQVQAVLDEAGDSLDPALSTILEIGLNHEEQHQELILTDLKHAFSCNPLLPAYQKDMRILRPVESMPLDWASFDEGLYWIGHDGEGFSYDNERPRHRVFVPQFQLATRLVTNGEFLQFMEDDGYKKPHLWLSEGWNVVQQEGWRAPLYWQPTKGSGWRLFTLSGLRPIDPAEPACHVSYFEADAYARWAGARLPTEAEWEVAADAVEVSGNFVEGERFHPRPVTGSSPKNTQNIRQLFGDVWEWTASQYLPYPGYQAPAGALGEYNGKFMCNQFVLRGGSCVTPQRHVRRTYRNYFPPAARWQFTGIRLAR